MKIKKLTLFTILISIVSSINCQSFVADKLVAVVGKSSILYSEVEEQYLQYVAQNQSADRCSIFEDLLAQKLLVTQAEVDSLEVTDPEVDLELEQRLTYFINQIGSEEKLVEYFNKSIVEIKEDMRDAVFDQLMMQKMQAEIVKGMTITPDEVKKFYNTIPKDSLPYVDSEIELNQIVIYPKSSEESVLEVKDKLLKIRQRILDGENFATLAVLYSEGPSASRGGDIGWVGKANLDPAYVKAAMALKKGQVSKIVESSFGYHIIKLEDKTDDRLKTSHILMNPKVDIETKLAAKNKLDSISRVIRLDSLTFERAAMIFSQDEDTRLNGGLKINPATLTRMFRIDEFPTNEYYIIRNLEVGEISEPFESKDDKGKTIYKIIRLKSRTKPHTANLDLDFDLIKSMALAAKKTDIVNEWIAKKIDETFVRIESPFDDCDFRIEQWRKK